MALLTYQDIEKERNIDLSSPNGQMVATALIAAGIAEIEQRVGYALESAEQTKYFSDGESDFYLPTNAPVSDLALAVKSNGAYANKASDRFDWDNSRVQSFDALPEGLKAVRATYTAGWTIDTFKKEALREALVDMVALKLQAVASFSSADQQAQAEGEGGDSAQAPTGPVKKLSVDGYSVEYSSAESDAYWKAKAAQLSRSIGDDLPPGVERTINSYKLVDAR